MPGKYDDGATTGKANNRDHGTGMADKRDGPQTGRPATRKDRNRGGPRPGKPATEKAHNREGPQAGRHTTGKA